MVEFNFKEYSLDIPSNVYYPSHDTDLLLEVIEKEVSNKHFKKALELGAGNGVLGLAVYDVVSELYSLDISDDVIEYLTKINTKYKLNKQQVLKSDLFSAIPSNKKFDLILFNPPYLPSNKDLNELEGIELAFDGGKNGSEIILRFLKDLKNYLEIEGVCYLLISSLNNLKFIEQKIKDKNLKSEIVNKKRIFFEELFVLKITF